MQFSRVLAPVLCAFLPLWAVETQVWEHSESADFEKGTLRKLSLSSAGRLTPAPMMRQLYDPSVSFLWSIARDSKGSLYAGGGSALLHAKFALADDRFGYLGSANMTGQGFGHHFEIGVRLGPEEAADLVRILDELKSKGFLNVDSRAELHQ